MIGNDRQMERLTGTLRTIGDADGSELNEERKKRTRCRGRKTEDLC
jgi:hypothetical protein